MFAHRGTMPQSVQHTHRHSALSDQPSSAPNSPRTFHNRLNEISLAKLLNFLLKNSSARTVTAPFSFLFFYFAGNFLFRLICDRMDDNSYNGHSTTTSTETKRCAQKASNNWSHSIELGLLICGVLRMCADRERGIESCAAFERDR